MRIEVRGILAVLVSLLATGHAAAEWRCDCTSIVGSCSATATVRESFIEVASNVQQCSRVDYLVDGRPFVSLVVDGSGRQDWIARSEAPSIIVQGCQICRDLSDNPPAAAVGPGLISDGEVRKLIDVAPTYPAAAAAAGVEGHVDIRFRVSATGTVSAPEVIDAEPAGVFEAAALAAVSRWRFTQPAETEPTILTERIEFRIANQLLSLRASPRTTAAMSTRTAAARNSCVREDSRFDFGASVDISLLNACEDMLLVYSCATGTGTRRDRWNCSNPEADGRLLATAGRPAAGILLDTPGGQRTFSADARLEISRAPNSEYWWLACTVEDAVCRDEGRQWVRSLDRQPSSMDPQDRSRVNLARSY